MSNREDFECWDEREFLRLSAIAHLLDSPSPDPLFDNPLPDIEDDLDLPPTRHRVAKPAKREAVRHG